MKAKRLSALFLAVLLTAAITGCSGASTSSGGSDLPPSSGGDSPDGEGTSLSGKLSIWSWGADAEKEAREAAVRVFIEGHPELEVEHVVLPTADSVWDQKSAAAFAAGTAGDVMQMSPDYYGLMTQYYEDLKPYAEAEGVKLEDVIVEGMLGGYYRPDGKLEALPLLANCFVFAYNKDLFDRAGVDYPTDAWTWKDLAEMAPLFVSGEGVNRTYFMVNHWVLPNFALICQGGVPYNDDFTQALVDSAEVAAGLDLFGGLIKAQAVPDDVSAENLPKEQLFVSGRAAVYPMGGFEISAVSEEIGDAFEWGAVLPPKAASGGENTNITYATGYAMNTSSRNKAAAWQFLKEVSYSNDDMAKKTMTAGMPANRKVAENDFSAITYGAVSTAKYVDGLATSRLNIWGGALATAGDQWTQMWQSVTIAGKTGAQAQSEYAPLIKQAFEELNIR